MKIFRFAFVALLLTCLCVQGVLITSFTQVTNVTANQKFLLTDTTTGNNYLINYTDLAAIMAENNTNALSPSQSNLLVNALQPNDVTSSNYIASIASTVGGSGLPITNASLLITGTVADARLNQSLFVNRAVTPWATTGDVSSNSKPFFVYSTVVSTNNGTVGTNDYRAFPNAAYDPSRKRIIALWDSGSSHYESNCMPVLSFSYDGGKTWQGETPLTNAVPVGTFCGLGVKADGTIMLSCWYITYPGGTTTYNHNAYLLESTNGAQSWFTNSVFDNTGEVFTMSPGSIVQTPNGNIIAGWYYPVSPASYSNGVFVASDGGSSWTRVNVDPAGSENCLAVAQDGSLWMSSRDSGGISLYKSLDSGYTWSNKGTIDFASTSNSWYASKPMIVFMGNRLVLASRTQPYGQSCLWYSDVPPYTNGWTSMYRSSRPSLYDAPVLLSSSVALLISAFDSTATVADSAAYSSNTWVEAWVLANNGKGWSQTADEPSQPVIDLRSSSVPAIGDRLTKWPNYGTLGSSPTNGAGFLGPLGSFSTNNQNMLWSFNKTNSVTFGVSNILSSYWLTNSHGTVIWRSGRTNLADNTIVLDNKSAVSTKEGFTIRFYGANLYFDIGSSGGADFAAKYALNGGSDYSGTPHVYGLRWQNGMAQLYIDGHLNSSATPTGTGIYPTATSSWLPLFVGCPANSTGGSSIFLSDVQAYTNVLSDAELYARMANMNTPVQGVSLIANPAVPIIGTTISSADLSVTVNPTVNANGSTNYDLATTGGGGGITAATSTNIANYVYSNNAAGYQTAGQVASSVLDSVAPVLTNGANGVLFGPSIISITNTVQMYDSPGGSPTIKLDGSGDILTADEGDFNTVVGTNITAASGGYFHGNGSFITSLQPTNMAAGTLPTNVQVDGSNIKSNTLDYVTIKNLPSSQSIYGTNHIVMIPVSTNVVGTDTNITYAVDTTNIVVSVAAGSGISVAHSTNANGITETITATGSGGGGAAFNYKTSFNWSVDLGMGDAGFTDVPQFATYSGSGVTASLGFDSTNSYAEERLAAIGSYGACYTARYGNILHAGAVTNNWVIAWPNGIPTGIIVCYGLQSNRSAQTNQTDGVFMSFEPMNSANWIAYCISNSVSTRVDTGSPIATGTDIGLYTTNGNPSVVFFTVGGLTVTNISSNIPLGTRTVYFQTSFTNVSDAVYSKLDYLYFNAQGVRNR